MQTLFSTCALGNLESLNDGVVQFNDQAVPLNVQGKNFDVRVCATRLDPSGHGSRMSAASTMQQVDLAAESCDALPLRRFDEVHAAT